MIYTILYVWKMTDIYMRVPAYTTSTITLSGASNTGVKCWHLILRSHCSRSCTMWPRRMLLTWPVRGWWSRPCTLLCDRPSKAVNYIYCQAPERNIRSAPVQIVSRAQKPIMERTVVEWLLFHWNDRICERRKCRTLYRSSAECSTLTGKERQVCRIAQMQRKEDLGSVFLQMLIALHCAFAACRHLLKWRR